MEKPTQITIAHKDDLELQPSQIIRVKGETKPDLWMVCCPLCGGLGELRTHRITENEDGTITISPSLVCNGSIYKAPHTYEQCTAHYFVEHNQIKWV